MNEVVLSVSGLRVDYEDRTAVDDVSFEIERGMVYGLIGPNGAGKTTTMRAIAHLVEPTWGRIRVAGIDVQEDPRAAMLHVGFMPDAPPLYEDLTAREFLEVFASAHNLPQRARGPRIDELLEKVKLAEKRDALAGSLSRGMRQRLFLAKTLLHDPALLILDEPASGLDPLARLELRDVLVELGRQGRAILVSSHILSEMADFCNAVGIMERGRMLVSGRVDDILARMRSGTTVSLRLLRDDGAIASALAEAPGVRDVHIDHIGGPELGARGAYAGGGGVVVNLQLDGGEAEAAALLRSLVLREIPVVDFHRRQGSLEDVFMHVSTGSVS